MPVQFIIEAKDGADAAVQLLDFVGILRNPNASPAQFADKPVQENPVKTDKPAPVADKAAPAAEDKAVDKAPDKAPETTGAAAEEPAKEEAKPTSSRRKAAGKKDDAPADAAKPAAETTTAAPEFTAPAGFNDAVKADGSASDEVVKAAYEKVEQFRPKEGEPVSLNYCRALLLYMAAKKGMDHNRKMLDTFGVQKIQDLAADRFGDFALKMTEALKA